MVRCVSATGITRAPAPGSTPAKTRMRQSPWAAAIQAEILSGGFKKRPFARHHAAHFARSIETFGGLMNVIIPRNTTIPTKAGEVFTTAVDRQPSILIHVLQGERERAKDNWSLGKIHARSSNPRPR